MSSLEEFQSQVEAAIEATGCTARGWIDLCGSAHVPGGGDCRSLVLVGAVGNRHWPAFEASTEFCDGAADPLDRWSRRIVTEIAASFGGVAVFPFGGPPHWPFQRWAKAADGLESSPIGILIHPTYGLWHAYRGAIAFSREIEALPAPSHPSPCETCAEKPCLSACPVEAFSTAVSQSNHTVGGRYAVENCADHLRSPEGEDCMAFACRARRACPVGAAFAYRPAQARFLMDAFLLSRPGLE